MNILKKAGIESCDAVCAVTEDDDLNIMASQMAKEMFGVQRVFARIADVDKVDVFKGFGIHTVCPTRLTVQSACAAIEDVSSETEVFFERSPVRFTTMNTPAEYVGSLPGDIELEPGESLFALIRPNGAFLLYSGQVITLTEQDKLVFAKKI